ncbi:MAG TPA: hypothetical protein PKE03_12630, partial [Bacteroidales bacterium]|nr:hypothetical protein [Bacteroidales bacterium]
MNSHIFPLQFFRIFEKFISRLAVLLFALCSTVSVLAQSAYTRTGSYNEQAIMRLMVMEGKGNAGLASDIRPYPTASVTAWLDSLNYPVRNRTTKYNIQWLKYENAISPLDHSEADTPEANPKRRLFNNPAKLIVLSNDKAYLAINPGFDFSLGMSREEELPLFVNTRMLELEGNIAGKVGFYSRVEETQLRLARHEQQFFGRWRVLPGAHLVKPYRTRGYDYLTATGYITYSPIKEIMLQFGQDRNIIGNGMRSLLLSDFALDYPFLKIHTRVGKFDYVNLYARLTDSYSRITNPRQYRLLPAKYYAMHYLSVQIKPSWRIGLFEAVMFHDNNLTGKGFDVSYLNPVILYRAIEHQRGDPDKMTVGLNTQYRAAPGCAFYGQFLLNEFRFNDLINRTGSHANKYGWQLGMHLAGD